VVLQETGSRPLGERHSFVMKKENIVRGRLPMMTHLGMSGRGLQWQDEMEVLCLQPQSDLA